MFKYDEIKLFNSQSSMNVRLPRFSLEKNIFSMTLPKQLRYIYIYISITCSGHLVIRQCNFVVDTLNQKSEVNTHRQENIG